MPNLFTPQSGTLYPSIPQTLSLSLFLSLPNTHLILQVRVRGVEEHCLQARHARMLQPPQRQQRLLQLRAVRRRRARHALQHARRLSVARVPQQRVRPSSRRLPSAAQRHDAAAVGDGRDGGVVGQLAIHEEP